MERTISIEDRIKKAEEIYARRHEGITNKTATLPVNNKKNRDIKLFKKMIIQIIVSVSIYMLIYLIQNNNYIFSEDFINKTNEILSYDMNFMQIYEKLKANIKDKINEIENDNPDGAIGGAEIEETSQLNEVQSIENESLETQEEGKNENLEENEEIAENVQAIELTQEDKDIEKIKETTTFIKPVEGVISSKFGERDPTSSNIPKNHTGIDIAANMGTKILASTSGEVVLASEEGDFGKHLKIQIGEVSIIYAHCNKLYVNQGDTIEQGQEIAEVGSTGNSTGPHLHFEIRVSERIINPEKIIEI